MPTRCDATPVLIQKRDHLAEVVASLANQPRLAVDTESNSLYAYREQVCLIQVSIPGADYLIDPLALIDLTPLWRLFEDPAVEKVLHAAEYDLLCLRRDHGVRLANLFDTRVASRTLGRRQAGLGELLAEEFGIHVDKRLQRANWGQRPLPPALLLYASLDTHYLLPLRDRLAVDLRRAGLWQEAAEEFERLTRLQPRPNGFDPQGFWRITGARHLLPQQAAVLEQLYLLREDHARRSDRPPFKVLSDSTLLAIAQSQPRTLGDLSRVPGVSPSMLSRYGKEILAAVAHGLRNEPPHPPRLLTADDATLARYEALRAWRKRKADQRRVESDVILPRDLLWQLATCPPRTQEQLTAILEPLHWRAQTYGPEILRLLWGQGSSS